MTEQTTPAPTAPQAINVQIGLGAQYIKDFSFENPGAPQIFSTLETPPQLSIDVNVLSRGGQDLPYEVTLKLKVEAKIADKIAFIAELAYCGLFVLPQHLPQDQVKLFLLVEAPRLLFPFARTIISNSVRDGGFPGVSIQPIDFMSLYLSQKESVGWMTAAGAA